MIGAKSPLKEDYGLPKGDNNMFENQWTFNLFNHKVIPHSHPL